MELTLNTALALFGGGSVVAIAIATFATNLLNQRLLSKWRRDEQTSAEGLKHSFANERLLLESAIRGSQQGLDKGHEKRLDAIEKVWSATVRLRDESARMRLLFTILLPSEYDDVFKPGQANLAAWIADVNDTFVTKMMQGVDDVEAVRPYLGELLWGRFFIYRAFIGRIGYLVCRGRERRHIDDWREDRGVKQILAGLIPSATSQELFGAKQDVMAMTRTVQHLESLILQEISTTLSGQRSALESFENGKELSRYVANLSSESGGRDV